MSHKLGWNIGTIVRGVGGLHFHRECLRDGHPCPGSRVSKSEILARVLGAMAGLGGGVERAASPEPVPGAPPSAPAVGTSAWVQMRLNQRGAHPPLVVDGDLGPASRAAIESFQMSRDLDVDGIVGPDTLAALSA
ncbi:MAG: peptidoglycan-binding protein [Pseudomonadota bacterium]|nr:peptidoglycan-binding protein [Pseudomonadota bacterium]